MKTFVLIMLFWHSEHSAMAVAEFNSQQTCEAAKAAASKEMDSSWSAWGHQLYAVCAEK